MGTSILAILPEVEAVLTAKGRTVQRSIYDTEQAVPSKTAENDGAKRGIYNAARNKIRKSEKQNFETTSEEGE